MPGPPAVKGDQVQQIKIIDVSYHYVFSCLLKLHLFEYVFVMSNFDNALLPLSPSGKYWPTRTEGYDRDARTACKLYISI